MSMKIAQLKWIGLALVATGLSAGGAIGLAAVKAQDPAAKEGTTVSVGWQHFADAAASATATTTCHAACWSLSASTEKRLRAMEAQVDRIYRIRGLSPEADPPDISTLDRLEFKLNFLLRQSQ